MMDWCDVSEWDRVRYRAKAEQQEIEEQELLCMICRENKHQYQCSGCDNWVCSECAGISDGELFCEICLNCEADVPAVTDR